MKSMLAVEQSLGKDSNWAQIYQSQIEDMVARGAARVMPESELNRWEGVTNYIRHLAALNPRSSSTLIRIVFDALHAQGGGPSLNKILAKGPDRYLNNLSGVIICFRNGHEVAKSDVRKMYNTVLLEKEDCCVQIFLWRDMNDKKTPDTFQVIVNNIGVKDAGDSLMRR